MQNRALCHAVIGFAMIAACGVAHADDAVIQPEKAAGPAWTLVTVPTHRGDEAFLVESLDLIASGAMRDRSSEAVFNGGIAPEPEAGFQFFAQVVVRTDDADTLALLTANAAKLTPAGAPGNPLEGFWLVECASVAQAIDLAAALRADKSIREAYLDIQQPTANRSDLPSDPSFPQQWYLHNTSSPLSDANLEPAWKAGFTGAGLTVAIVEYGWYTLHPDLAAKFNSDASQAGTGWQSHGTSVAGIIGMIADNEIGGAGAAYGASLSKLYIGSTSVTAAAFGFRNDLNAVKNNSWGPVDNGIARKLSSIEAAGLADAITNGRNGLGTVFVWAGGNGGTGVDRVDYDPYASNRYVLAIGAIDSADRRSLYSEPGSSLLAVAQSDYDLNSFSDNAIFTTSSIDGYTTSFGGTSASSPLAAGIVALILDANPNLSWRDVRAILIRSARHCRPFDSSWRVNGAGLNTSEQFGFGAVDAGAAVALAQSWAVMGPEVIHDTGVIVESAAIPDNNIAGLTRTVVVPTHLRIESVELVLNATHNACGQLRVSIEAPGGLTSLVANTRTDNANTYNGGYVFTSVRHFGERAGGTWEIKVSDTVAGMTGILNDWQLRFYGTEITCPCDWDADGDTDVPDIFAFLSSWFAAAADFDLSGATEVPDIFAFLACWFGGGCP